MRAIWSPENRIIVERRLWVAVLKAQRDLGVDIDDATVRAYEEVVEEIDLASIAHRETRLQHDLMARIEEFCALAGRERIHLALTSRDITENCEQVLVMHSLRLIAQRARRCLRTLTELARRYRDTPIIARTHNVPAQPTTVGRKLAMRGEEYLYALSALDSCIEGYKFRGIKGAVGTQSDLLKLLGGESAKVAALEHTILDYLKEAGRYYKDNCIADDDGELRRIKEKGTPNREEAERYLCVGQVYPRSLDAEMAHRLTQVVAAPASLALDIRLMAGVGLINEGHGGERVGSSAMPHKANPSMCERISGLNVVTKGFMGMLVALSGNQWNEGDVSCSVVRRVALPNIFYAAEGLLNTLSVVLKGLTVESARAHAELQRELPYIMTSRLLMAAVRAGVGRERAHAVLRRESEAARREEGGVSLAEHPLVQRLASAPDFALSSEEIVATIDDAPLWGTAVAQVDHFIGTAEEFLKRP